MKKVALIGMPLAHSVSPAMHMAAFHAANLDWVYQAIETEPSRLSNTIDALRSLGWAGGNVTVPYKERVLGLLDQIDDQARRIGAVNTIVNRQGILKGYNTDVRGFLTDLTKYCSGIAGTKAVVMGAGGGARAVVFALTQAGAQVEVLCRRGAQGRKLLQGLELKGRVRVALRSWTKATFASIEEGALIVNTTPVGMWPQVDESPWPDGVALPMGAFIYDLVYNPHQTRLLQQAAWAGLPAVNGLGMLVEQGALAFELWAGRSAPRRIMRSAAEAALVVGHA